MTWTTGEAHSISSRNDTCATHAHVHVPHPLLAWCGGGITCSTPSHGRRASSPPAWPATPSRSLGRPGPRRRCPQAAGRQRRACQPHLAHSRGQRRESCTVADVRLGQLPRLRDDLEMREDARGLDVEPLHEGVCVRRVLRTSWQPAIRFTRVCVRRVLLTSWQPAIRFTRACVRRVLLTSWQPAIRTYRRLFTVAR